MIIFVAGAPFSFTGNAARPFPIRYLEINGLNRLVMEDIAAFYGMRQRIDNKKIKWYGNNMTAKFTVDRRKAEINGTTVHLSYAIADSRDTALLGKVDFYLLVDPLLRNRALPRQKVRTVVIDPGHGGKDPGAEGKSIQEKKIVLQISLRLAQMLHQKGLNVLLTRSDDTFVRIPRRAEIAEENNADIFISIHVNSTSNPSVHGVETFFLPPPNTPGTYSTHPDHRRHDGHAFVKSNTRLAFETQRNILEQTDANDRGIKHSGLSVLSDLSCPGILVEAGFISNRKEERKLATPIYQHRIAAGIARGILAYHRSVTSE